MPSENNNYEEKVEHRKRKVHKKSRKKLRRKFYKKLRRRIRRMLKKKKGLIVVGALVVFGFILLRGCTSEIGRAHV